MTEAKKFEQKTVTIGETEYIFQKLPIRKAMQMRQRYTQGNVIDDIKMSEELLEHVVVSPKRKLDDFDDYSELDALMTEAITFQYGGKFTKNN